MTEPNLKQYAVELAELEKVPPAAIELYPFEAIAIISVVQLGSRHPSVATDSELTKIAINVALKLQALFSPESATYKVLELGWNGEKDILVEKTDFDRSVFDATKFDENYPLWNEDGDGGESFDNYIGESELDRFKRSQRGKSRRITTLRNPSSIGS